MNKPKFVQMALDWLVRATGHVPIGREQSLAVELERVHEAGVQAGMIWGAAIIAMAEAIWKNAPRLVERHYWTSEIDGTRYYDCFCPGCGVQMKKCTPGVDEGTDNEWCGACRY